MQDQEPKFCENTKKPSLERQNWGLMEFGAMFLFYYS